MSQQQGGGCSLTFSSQVGRISPYDLPLVCGSGAAPQPAGIQVPPVNGDVIPLSEKLGQLRDSGVLTPEKLQAKKTELLSRI